MPDLPFPTLVDLSLPDFSPSHTIQALSQDENLLQHARQRLHDCRREMLELMARTPTVRATIDALLKQQFLLEGARVGLQSPPAGDIPASRFSLTEACAFLLKHPTTDTSALGAAQVVQLPVDHALANLTAPQLLERVRQLDIKTAVTTAWNGYWASRAPGTPVSRRQRAAQLYRNHFEAAGLWLKAQSPTRADPLKPLFTLIDPPKDTLAVDGLTVFTEQLLLKRSDASLVELPGAWVVTLDTEQPVSQLLYVPFGTPVWQVFTQRTGMERWVLDHQVELFGAQDPSATVTYRIRSQPLSTGIEQWLSLLAEAQWRSASAPLDTQVFRLGAPSALLHTDELDQHRRSQPLFSAPPLGQPASADAQAFDSPPAFGLLSADLAVSQHHAMIRQQRQAIEALLADASRMRAFKLQLDALKQQQQAANTAAQAMLARRPLDTATLNTHYTLLYTARREGLRAEAKLQQALAQISIDELTRLETVLDHPLRADRTDDACVASITLSITRKNNATATVTTHELKGPLVIATAQALAAPPEAAHSLLLYWPGSGGGLQRFGSRQALALSVLHILPDEQVLSADLKELTVDALDHGLNLQQVAFDEQAAQVRLDHPAPLEDRQQQIELQKLRLRALETLRVPRHEARDLAYLQIIEQDNSSHLAEQLPAWLRDQALAHRARLKPLIQAYLPALRRAQGLFDQSLPARDDYVRLQIDARLRRDFDLKHGYSVQLELPDAVQQQRDTITGGNIGGTPTRIVDVPSSKRSKISLEQLAVVNIDSAMSLRLGFVSAHVKADNDTEKAALQVGLTGDYLLRMVRDLNLAKQYERLIYDTFNGHDQESTFERQYRREALIEPWRLMLRLQGLCARMQDQLTDDELRLLDIAIDADSESAWRAGSWRISLLPAHLAIGGRDTKEEQPITLAGITFIHEETSGRTLLYLPDTPDQRFLRRYDSLDQARRGLFDLCQTDNMVLYVAGRAIKGDVRAHMLRIDQAQQKRFVDIIGAGTRWPVTTSLAAHQLNAHMGRLIEAHRNDARSNEDLALERYALKSGHLFNGIKIALGFVPFVGTAVSLIDGVTNLHGAIDAFRHGDTHHGIEQLASVFECLMFAAMDVVPMLAVPAVRADAARQLMRLRQNSLTTGLDPTWKSLPSRRPESVLQRFDGYAYEKPISLAGLQPANEGIYRQVYRHGEGDFIVNQGQVFQVEYDKTYRTLRLSGTRTKSYKQPVGLDNSGGWDTHGALYGALVDGGLAGGGNVLGALLDHLEPRWPVAIRALLPLEWTDHAMRRHMAINRRINAIGTEMDPQLPRTNALLQTYQNAHAVTQTSLAPALQRALAREIELATRQYQALQEVMPFNSRSNLRALQNDASRSAWIIVDRSVHQARIAARNVENLANAFDAIHITSTQAGDLRRTFRQRKEISQQILNEMDVLESAIEHINTWRDRLTVQAHRDHIGSDASLITRTYDVEFRDAVRTSHRIETFLNYDDADDYSHFYLQGQLFTAYLDVNAALQTQRYVSLVSTTPTQRMRILESCISSYNQFRVRLMTLSAGYPRHFDMPQLEPLLTELEKMAHHARRRLAERAPIRPATQPNEPRREVFETEDNRLLIGSPSNDPTTGRPRYEIENAMGQAENWVRNSSGRYQLQNPTTYPLAAPDSSTRTFMINEAKQRITAIPDYVAKVKEYAGRNMLPVDVEEMMIREAAELTLRSNRIARVAADDTIIQQLKDESANLTRMGRQLRTEQTLKTRKPTDGMLDDLARHGVVEVKKTSPLQALGKRPDGRTDYLQEFEIWTKEPARLLWYAHFHYSKKTPLLGEFEKGHLKLPEHRFLTHADAPDLPYAEIGKKSSALEHFKSFDSAFT